MNDSDVNIWCLGSNTLYLLHDRDNLVKRLLREMGIPKLFPEAHDQNEINLFVAFDNHPTHWILVFKRKGFAQAIDNGLFLEAYPKSDPKKKILDRLAEELGPNSLPDPFPFSQIPSKDDNRP